MPLFLSSSQKTILSSSLISSGYCLTPLLPCTADPFENILCICVTIFLSPVPCEPTTVSGFYSCIAASLWNSSFWGCPSPLHSSSPWPVLRGIFFAYSVASDTVDYSLFLETLGASLVAQTVKNLPAKQETWVRSLGWEDPLEKGHGYSLQYSCLENSRDRGAWRATVHGVAKRQTRLSDFHFHWDSRLLPEGFTLAPSPSSISLDVSLLEKPSCPLYLKSQLSSQPWAVFYLHSSCHHLIYYMVFFFIFLLSPIDFRFHKTRDFCLFCSFVFPQCLKEYLETTWLIVGTQIFII